MQLIVHNYDDLIKAFRERQAALGVTNERLDELSGLPSGYVGKLFGQAQMKKLAPYIALGVLLEALGLRLTVTIDEETTAKMQGRWGQRERPLQHHASRRGIGKKDQKFPRIMFGILGRRSLGWLNYPPEIRQRAARKAANVRWARYRIERRAARAREKRDQAARS
jgi:hypothetical protein